MNELLEALKSMAGTAGTVIDTPGSFGRGLAIGDLERALGGISDPRRRVGVDEVIKKHPWLDAMVPDQGIPGMVGKMGVSMATDPLTLALMLGPAVMGMTLPWTMNTARYAAKALPGEAGVAAAAKAAAPSLAARLGAAPAAKAAAVAKPAAKKVLTVKTAKGASPAASKILAEQAAREAAKAADDAAYLAKVVSSGPAETAKAMKGLAGIPPAKMGAAEDIVRAYHECIGIADYNRLESMIIGAGKQLSKTEVEAVARHMNMHLIGSKTETLKNLVRRTFDRLESWQRTQF